MEHSEYVMLSGAGAEEFALARGFNLVPRSYFTPRRAGASSSASASGDAALSPLTISHVGTVGAVATDGTGASPPPHRPAE